VPIQIKGAQSSSEVAKKRRENDGKKLKNSKSSDGEMLNSFQSSCQL